MEEVLREEYDDRDSAEAYLEFLKAKVLDIPVPAHLEKSFGIFKDKY